MKKYDEGYVLAYVMVIMAVLTLVALSVMTVSLDNLQKQRSEVEKMQDKYAAQGAIEQAIETLEGINTLELLDNVPFTDADVEVLDGSVEGNACIIVISAQPGSVLITCELQVECEQLSPAYSGEGYALAKPSVQKTLSYKITTVQDSEGGGEA